MPNPPGRRRSSPSAPVNSGEIQRLQTELNELKAAYARDVILISEDIHALNAQINPEQVPDA